MINRMISDLPPSLPSVAEALAAQFPRFPNTDFLTLLLRGLHSSAIVKHVREMFQTNGDWLDLVLLQEVNNATLLSQQQDLYTFRSGPLLVSSGDRESHQEEYFPLLIRAGADITVKKVYVIHTTGVPELVDHGKKIVWDKQGDEVSYRPIVLYEIEKRADGKAQLYWIGSVHTTPQRDTSGNVSEYHRKKIYEQLSQGLRTLAESAKKYNIPLIIGGDYYLSAEAVVKGWDSFPQLSTSQQQELTKLKGIIQQQIQSSQQRLHMLKGQVPEKLLEWYRFQQEAARDDQVLRNACQLTMAAQIKQLGLLLAQPLSGTNPKRKPLEDWLYLQIADFFVHNNLLVGAVVGILRPQGKIMLLDTENLKYSRYWQYFSDHFPVGAVFSMNRSQLMGHLAVAGAGSPKAIELAKISNIRRFARLQLKAEGKSVQLDLYSEGAIGQLARNYLKGRQTQLRDKLWKDLEEERMEVEQLEENPDIDLATLIRLIQALEDDMSEPESTRLFLTSPADFEADEEQEV